MANKMSIKYKFQINEVLPPNLIIRGADSHLYRNGLSLFECKTKIKRKWYYSPIIVWFWMIFNLIKHIMPFLVELGGADNHLIIGDMDYFSQSIGVINIVSVICDSITLSSQLINVYNKWRGIKMDLTLFEMLAGYRSPESIDLKDKNLVLKLIKFSKRALKCARVSIIVLTWNTFLMALLVFCLLPTSYALLPKILLIVSWALFYAIWLQYFINVLYYQFAYFSILCYYLYSKLSQINRRIVNKEKNIYRIIIDSTIVYQEIGHYNSNYWSKFLLVVYAAMSSLIALLTFVSLVVGIADPLVKMIFFSYAFCNSFFLLLTIIFSSLIYDTTVHSYHLFNSYVHSVKHIYLRKRIKLLALMERIGKKRIGFHCWKLFIINSKVGFELLAIMCAVFARISKIYFKKQMLKHITEITEQGGSIE